MIAANRDEYLDRPAEPPALRLWHGRTVLAPRDARAGGTWLGTNDAGVFAALTNRPNREPRCDPPLAGSARRRRARGGSAAEAAARLVELPAGAYNPFNLSSATPRDAFVAVYEEKAELTASRRRGPRDRQRRSGQPLACRRSRGCSTRPRAIARGSAEDALTALERTCAAHDSDGAPLERPASTRGAYGTRSSTLMRRGRRPEQDVFRFADGPPCRPWLSRLHRASCAAGPDRQAYGSRREEARVRRIGSNIRRQNAEAKPSRVIRNIIRYSDEEKPSNEYPKRIVSPTKPSRCCSEENRVVVGSVREVDGFKFCYKICEDCGHAVRYYYPAVEGTPAAVKDTASGRSTWSSSPARRSDSESPDAARSGRGLARGTDQPRACAGSAARPALAHSDPGRCWRGRASPKRRLRVLHVAGSKGKGSTALLSEALLREAGALDRRLHLAASRALDRTFPHRRLRGARRRAGGGHRGAPSARGSAPRGARAAELLRCHHRRRIPAVRGRGRGSRDRGGRPRRAARLDQRRRARGLLHHEHRARAHRSAGGHVGRDRRREGGHREVRASPWSSALCLPRLRPWSRRVRESSPARWRGSATSCAWSCSTKGSTARASASRTARFARRARARGSRPAPGLERRARPRQRAPPRSRGRPLARRRRARLPEVVLPGRIEICARAPWIIVDGAHTAASARALAATLHATSASSQPPRAVRVGREGSRRHLQRARARGGRRDRDPRRGRAVARSAAGRRGRARGATARRAARRSEPAPGAARRTRSARTPRRAAVRLGLVLPGGIARRSLREPEPGKSNARAGSSRLTARGGVAGPGADDWQGMRASRVPAVGGTCLARSGSPPRERKRVAACRSLRRASPGARAGRGATQFSSLRSGHRRWEALAAQARSTRARRCAGPVPQQPPTHAAPAATPSAGRGAGEGLGRRVASAHAAVRVDEERQRRRAASTGRHASAARGRGSSPRPPRARSRPPRRSPPRAARRRAGEPRYRRRS